MTSTAVNISLRHILQIASFVGIYQVEIKSTHSAALGQCVFRQRLHISCSVFARLSRDNNLFSHWTHHPTSIQSWPVLHKSLYFVIRPIQPNLALQERGAN